MRLGCLLVAWFSLAVFSRAHEVSRHRRLTSKPKVLAQPDYNIYLKKEKLLQEVQNVVNSHPSIFKLETQKVSDGNYSAELLVVTLEPSGLTDDNSKKARLLLDFGEHGREFITSELGLRLLRVLADPKILLEVAGNAQRQQRLLKILSAVVFKILPMENVNGRSKVEGGDLCERKNGRGVDTNRNWGVDWGKKETDYNPYEEYPGKAPFSEPEVQIILKLAESFKPHVWLNVHSGMEAMFTPYDHRPTVPEGPLPAASLRVLEVINKSVFNGTCVVGSGGKSVGYLAHGTATDYMFEKLLVPMSYTWEIFGDFKAHYDDCFKMFNPLTKDSFEAVLATWLQALLVLLELLPLHPAVGPLLLPLVGEAGIDCALWRAMVAGGGVTIAAMPCENKLQQNVGAASGVALNLTQGVMEPAPMPLSGVRAPNPALLALALVGLAAIGVLGFRWALSGTRQNGRRPAMRKPV